MTPHRSLAALAALAALACGLPDYTTSTVSEDTTTGNAGNTSSSASATAPATTSTTSDLATAGPISSCSTLDCTSSTGPQCFVEGGEGGELRCTLACDVWMQDCPEGQKCAPWAEDGGSAWNSTTCVDVVPDPGKPGDACTVEGLVTSGHDTCEKAAMCWNVDPVTGEGTCVGFCMGSQESPICPSGTHCEVSQDGALILCLPNCDPLAQDCGDGFSCIPESLGDGFLCVLDASGDTGTQNDTCEYANACDPGLFCAEPALASECDPNATGCCLPFCELSMPECTNQGAMCLPWYEMGMAPPGLENVGLCSLVP